MTTYRAKERNNRWRYHFQKNGRRYSGYCIHPKTGEEATTKRKADAFEKLIWEAAGTARRATPTTADVYTVAQMFADWLKHKHHNRHREMAGPRRHAKEWLDHLGAATAVVDITDDDITTYVTRARQQPVLRNAGGKGRNAGKMMVRTDPQSGEPVLRSDAAINRYLSSLMAAMALAVRKKRINPMHAVTISKLQESSRVPTPTTPDEAARVWAVAADHLRMAIGLAVYLGLREEESVTASPAMMNWHLRTLTLPETQKGKRQTVLQVSEHCYQLMRQGMERGERLWAAMQSDTALARRMRDDWGIHTRDDIPFVLYQDRAGLPRPIKTFRGAWNSARARAGVTKRFHDLRAYFVTELLASTDIRTVQGLARHTSVTTTMVYAGLVDARARAAVESLPAMGTLDAANPENPHTKPAHKADEHSSTHETPTTNVLKIKAK